MSRTNDRNIQNKLFHLFMPVAVPPMLVLNSSIFGIFHPIALTAASAVLSTSILSSGIAELLLNKFDDASYNKRKQNSKFVLKFLFACFYF